LAAKEKIAQEQKWRRNDCFDETCKTVVKEGNIARVKMMHNVVWTVVAMQYMDKQTPISMLWLRYFQTIIVETVFSLWSM
jgi:hypothetical protein